jgi:hypothetical protein
VVPGQRVDRHVERAVWDVEAVDVVVDVARRVDHVAHHDHEAGVALVRQHGHDGVLGEVLLAWIAEQQEALGARHRDHQIVVPAVVAVGVPLLSDPGVAQLVDEPRRALADHVVDR